MMVKKTQFPITVILSAIFFTACGTQQALVKNDAQFLDTVVQKPSEYLIQPQDELDIKFFFNPELNEKVSVRPDGKISLQLVDEVQAAGMTPAQLDEELTRWYAKELKKPAVTVIVRSFAGQQVFVGGEVNQQGMVDLSAGMSPLQAIIKAGGLKETAKPEEAILIRKGPDNRPIPVRLDLKGALYGKYDEADMKLQPFDIVYVPKTAIAQANKFVNQYIEQLILFRGWSFGISYDLNSDNN